MKLIRASGWDKLGCCGGKQKINPKVEFFPSNNHQHWLTNISAPSLNAHLTQFLRIFASR